MTRTFGEQLMTLRTNAGESLQDVADAVGVSKAHIWELEKGRSRNPSFDLVCRLADHFAVTPDVLAGRTQTPTAQGQALARLHRQLDALPQEDLTLIETMVQSLEERRAHLAKET